MKSYVIIGLGRFGSKAATALYEYGEDVIAIDLNEKLVNSIANNVTRAVTADAKSKETLIQLGVADCDCAIVAVGTNFASSVLITMNLISIGVKRVICKAHDDTHKEILEKLGANKVIFPERDAAEKIARSLTSPNFLEFIELSDEYGIIEIAPPKSWIGKKIHELNIRNRHNVNIIALKSKEKTKAFVNADHVVEIDEKLVILGEYSALNQIKKIK